MDPEHLDGYLDVKFTAEHTREVYQSVLYPVLVLLVLFVARAGLFDNWTWPPALVALFVVNVVIIFSCICW